MPTPSAAACAWNSDRCNRPRKADSFPLPLPDLISHLPPAPRYWVAYSGGLDSEVLLHLLAENRQALSGELAAVHVNHGLQAEADAWEARCQRRCAGLGIPLKRFRLGLRPIQGESLEALARTARYRVFRQLLAPGELLLTAHHRDDQAETLLLALLRGSGLKGLAAMPKQAPLGAGQLLRPLLDEDRKTLLRYAREQGLSWISDPMNQDLALDRSYLRHQIIPELKSRWPSCAATIARSARHCAEAQALLEEVLEETLPHYGGRAGNSLSIRKLLAASPARQSALLRHWIARRALPVPDSRHLQRIQREVLRAAPDRSPLVAWRGAEIRRYRDDLFALPPLPPVPKAVLCWKQGKLTLPESLGQLRLTDPNGRQVDPITYWSMGLQVQFSAEERGCRPLGRGHYRRFKQLFQEAGIPPWLRSYLPYLFAGDQLVALGDRWCCVRAPAFQVRWEGGLREILVKGEG